MDEICAWIQSSTIADSHFNEHKYIHTIYKQYGAEERQVWYTWQQCECVEADYGPQSKERKNEI